MLCSNWPEYERHSKTRIYGKDQISFSYMLLRFDPTIFKIYIQHIE